MKQCVWQTQEKISWGNSIIILLLCFAYKLERETWVLLLGGYQICWFKCTVHKISTCSLHFFLMWIWFCTKFEVFLISFGNLGDNSYLFNKMIFLFGNTTDLYRSLFLRPDLETLININFFCNQIVKLTKKRMFAIKIIASLITFLKLNSRQLFVAFWFRGKCKGRQS